jgi:dTDP-4-amino-4,6-dideoxygalactose transaminase
MRQRNIGVNLHYIPVYKHPFYKKLGFRNNYCHQAETYYSGAMSIPIFSSLSIDDQDIVIDSLKELTA